MTKKVIINIRQGKISADFQGFQGRNCDRLADRIHLDGMEVEDKELKPEYQFGTHDETDDYTG